MSEYSIDVDASNYREVVLEGSENVPVVIDFWAEWCGPCKALKPILEKLAEEYQGKFILAKIDSDKNQELASQFQVRGIPSVKAVVNGSVVDEFSGALPESAVRQFLDRVIPSPAEQLRHQAAALRETGDFAGALQMLAEASGLDSGNEKVRLDAAAILVELGEMDEARRLLDSLSPATLMDAQPQQLLARINFAQTGKEGGDEAGLRDKLATNPADLESRFELANLLIASARYAAGMDELLEMIQRDRAWNEEAARKSLLSVFNMLAGDPLVAQYRRKLASALN